MDKNVDKDLIAFGFKGEKEIPKRLLMKYGYRYKRNQIIIKENEKTYDIYLILNGSCYVTRKEDKKYKILNYLGKGDIFGEMALFSKTERAATIIAKEDNTVVLKFSEEDFIEIFKLHPRWVDKIIHQMSDRIIKMIKKL